MALKVKAVEKLIKFDKDSAGTYRYVMSPELYPYLFFAFLDVIIFTILIISS